MAMAEDVQREFNHVYDKLNDANELQNYFSRMTHSQTQNDILDVQEAYSDIIFNDINDDLL
jgi:hypothetical protein